LVSLNSESTNDVNWNQFFDTESGMLINSKKRLIFFEKPTMTIHTPINQVFRKRLKCIKVASNEDIETKEDIETGNNTNQTINQENNLHVNLRHIIITTLFYMSHLALIIFMFTI
jgi:hypothetical protein